MGERASVGGWPPMAAWRCDGVTKLKWKKPGLRKEE
jgi:hypothetical protein